jgi:protein-disulfide isomerase
MMKNPWVVIAVIIVVLLGGAVIFSGAKTQVDNEGIVVASHIKGNPDATVTLVEYSDLECPACAAFQPVLNELLSQYENQIRFEYKHFPLPMHTYAMQAAVAAEAAGQQGKFYEFHDMVFENQDEWAKAATPNVIFIKYASDLGLDVELFKKQINSSLLRDKIKQDLKDGHELSVTGTPTFFLDGKKMEFNTYQAFIEQVAHAVDPNAVASSTSETSGTEVRFGL